MRFEELMLERYGAFTGRALTLRPDALLHVVLGANEAGKTSALSAIGDLLFGFGKRTDYDFLHESKTLRIGAKLRLADGSALSFRRRKGHKNTLLDAADRPLSDDLLAPLLGAVTRDTFFAEFGLTSRALREGGAELLKAGGRLAETLAASSARLAALSRLRAKLDAEAETLFGARRAAGKAFYIAADRYDDADKRLRAAIVTADALKAAEGAVAEAARKCGALREEHDKVGRDLARRQRAQRTRGRLARLDALRCELEAHRTLPLVNAETIAAWRAALEAQKRAEADLADCDAADAESDAAIAALAVDETLLAAGPAIDALREKLGAVRKAEEDLPKRRESQRLARDALGQAARALGLASQEELLARAPSDLALAAARELIDARKTAERRCAESQNGLAEARLELQKLVEEAGREGHAADPAPFALRLEAFADISADADRLRRDSAANDLEDKRLAEDAARLDPPAGGLDELARRPLPESGRIEAARAEWAGLAEDEKSAAADLAAAREALAGIEKDIARLSKAGAVATRDELFSARERRDAASVALEAVLDGEAARRRASFDALRAAGRAIDETTDLLLLGADRASRLEAAREQLAQARERHEELTAARAEIERRRRTAENAWAPLWAASGVAPHAPAAMAQWMERVRGLLERRRRQEERRSDSEALSRKLEAHRAGLTGLAEELGGGADSRLPVEALYKNARALADRAQRAWTASRERAVRRQGAAESVARLEAACARNEQSLTELRAAWRGAAAAIGAEGEATLAQTEAALAVWRDFPKHKQQFDYEDHRIRTMEDDIAAFETEAAKLVAGAAADLTGRPAREALDRLSARLALARAASQRRDALLEGAKKRAAARAALAAKRQRAEDALVDARDAQDLPAGAALDGALTRLERRAELTKETAVLLRDLGDIGDGLGEAALRAEQTDLDFDLLSSEIERLEIAHRQLVADIAEAATARHEVVKARDLLAAGRDAESAARDKAETAAELLSVAERWLERAAASRLAARAIERHRAAVQDPLLARASALFAIATADAFAGLCADYDDGDAPVLAGLRPDGARVPVAGMSEGARDQLYLSLRLALLELRGAEPLPFIGDDLLASFDDERAARALGLLAEFGRARQVILFTHHRHVAEIAKAHFEAAADVISL